jgi:hypothetical protein
MMPALFPGMTPCMMLDSQGGESFETNPISGHILLSIILDVYSKIKTLLDQLNFLSTNINRRKLANNSFL